MVLLPVDASHCQTLPASASHSHSIVNKPRKASNYTGFMTAVIIDTMKNTMFRIFC
jgi:hypothetical protein